MTLYSTLRLHFVSNIWFIPVSVINFQFFLMIRVDLARVHEHLVEEFYRLPRSILLVQSLGLSWIARTTVECCLYINHAKLDPLSIDTAPL